MGFNVGMMGFFYGGMMGFVEGGGGVPPAPMGALWGDRGSHRTPYTAGGGHCAQPLHAGTPWGGATAGLINCGGLINSWGGPP